MKIYNTLTRKKEEFVPQNPEEIQMYTCGPSIYDLPHIGNYRTFLIEDLLKRVLIHEGYKVRHIMNITDVETKGIVAAKQAKMDFWELMKKNTGVFFSELNEFRIIPADLYPLASESIGVMVKAVQEMMEKGFAYEYDGDIYFDISKSKTYGILSHSKFTEKHFKRRIRMYDYFQHQAGDFLLWYSYKKSDGNIFWNTSLGKGKPAWNAECPVLCLKFLKIPMDIHMGGIDNIFSHHENEIAQILALTNNVPAKYWVHVKHLMVDGKKMSKTLKNFYSIADLKQRGFSMMAIKWLLLSEVYTKRLNFTLEKLKNFEKQFSDYKETIELIKKATKRKETNSFESVIMRKRKLFFEALSDNLNFPKAFLHATNLLSEAKMKCKKGMLCNDCAKLLIETLNKFDTATGVFPTVFF